MIRIALASAACAALIAAAPASAERTPVEAANAAAPMAESGSPAVASDRDQRKICKTFEYSASRLKREKLCLTRDEWKKFEADQM
ncbi:MAG: hypothetical protein QOK17_2788 [Sphingomonadales bacterium]|jgi:hypothetical protein|nr:hypothetical protein [Sphingomonadales bacterium]